ncbi:MrcB family domain-containing protein [Lysinibacillus xylanilyticus]|uniref:MrcB family domain-containing protein n=1 Tax=Lysinibacillus xylanilyticus TaxID=582475 RepID=UPI0037F98FD5
MGIFGEKLKELRESRKVDLRDLARVIKVDHTVLHKIEDGAQRPDMETLEKVVDYFDVPADYFINQTLKLEDLKIMNFEQGDLSHAFKRVLDEYLDEKEKSFKGNDLGNFVRNDFVKILNETMSLDEGKYYVGGSVGQGAWATIPWISCFDRSVSKSATKGYYLVYLFKEDMSGFYLSLNQGYTYFREKYGAKEGRIKIQHTANLIRSKVAVSAEYNLTHIDLGSDRDLAIGYEKGHIYGKYYDTSNLPSENELISDFIVLLESYQKIVTFMNGRSVKEFNDYLLLQDDLKFLEIDEENYQAKANEIANGHIMSLFEQEEEPRPPKDPVVDEGGRKRYPRSAKEAADALLRANYTCEFDAKHETFTGKATNHQYAEAHHFIGISHHKKFPEVDLDRAANIVCLCPTCHRKIHHGVDEVRLPMIETLYQKINERLEKVGIEVTLTQLKEFYGISTM